MKKVAFALLAAAALLTGATATVEAIVRDVDPVFTRAVDVAIVRDVDPVFSRHVDVAIVRDVDPVEIPVVRG